MVLVALIVVQAVSATPLAPAGRVAAACVPPSLTAKVFALTAIPHARVCRAANPALTASSEASALSVPAASVMSASRPIHVAVSTNLASAGSSHLNSEALGSLSSISGSMTLLRSEPDRLTLYNLPILG